MRGRKTNHQCVICGTEYEACDDCPEVKNFAPWRTIACNEEHYQIFLVVNMYNSGILTKKEAKSKLKKLGFNEGNYIYFKQENQAVFKDIFAEDAKEKKANSKKEPEEKIESPAVVSLQDYQETPDEEITEIE